MNDANSSTVKELSSHFQNRLVVIKDLQLVEKQYFYPVLKIQKWYKGTMARKQYIKLKKRYRYRYYILKEIIETEEVYVHDLQQLVNKVTYLLLLILLQIIFPLQEKQLLKGTEIKKMFLNIKSIIGLNSAMLHFLKKQFTQYTPYQETLKGIQDYISYFKLYFEFCNGFLNARKMIQNYQNKNATFKKFIKENIQSFQTQDLLSILVKPVQRLPKYVLLFKDLLKHTDRDHPDYGNIENCLTQFESINDHNNQMMLQQIGSYRLFELQINFGDPNNICILDAKRKFKFEEISTILINKIAKDVVIYALSNMVLFVLRMDDYKLKYYAIVHLDENSFIKQQDDTKYFSNLFQLVGQNDTIQFTCENQQNKDKLILLFDQLLQELKQTVQFRYESQGINKPTFPVHVSILGTEERNLGLFSQFTIYIAQISIEQINMKVFVRFSEIQNLYNEIDKKFPSLKLPRLFMNQWNNKTTLVIEERKLEIEKLLQMILNTQEIRKNPQIILKILKLPDNFYELPILEASYGYIKEKGRCSFASIMKASQSKINLLQMKNLKVSENKQREIIIYTLEMEQFPIIVKSCTRAQEIVHQVGELLNLKHYFDFKLFLVDERNINQTRVLDDEELVLQLVEPKKGFLGYLSWKLSPFKYKIYLKKYIYFKVEVEMEEMRRDAVRLSLISHQLFEEIKQVKYYYDFKEYCLLCAIYIFIKVNNLIQISQYPQYRQLNKSIPKSIIKEFLNYQIYKEISLKLWKQNIKHMLISLTYEIEQIKRTQKTITITSSFCSVYENLEYIAQLILINATRINPLFGMSVFSVDLHKESAISMNELHKFIYLGVNYYGLHLMEPQKKRIFVQIKLNEIIDVKSYPFQILIIGKDQKFRFNSQHSYQVLIYQFQLSDQQINS